MAPQNDRQNFLFWKNSFYDKFANFSGCDNAKGVQIQAPDPLTNGSVPGLCYSSAPDPVIGSRTGLTRCPNQTLALNHSEDREFLPQLIETGGSGTSNK